MRTIYTVIILVSLSCTSWAQSPNWNEWFRQKRTQRKYLIQQIAALKVYLEYLKKGYEIVDQGLTTIGDIKNGTFNLDKDYFNSLKQVSPVVRNSPKVNDILVYNLNIGSKMRKLVEDCQREEGFTSEEVRYLESLRDKVLHRCDDSINELTIVTTSGQTEMKDDERLQRLDKVHEDMADLCAFVQAFDQSTRLLSRQRSKEKFNLSRSGQLNEI